MAGQLLIPSHGDLYRDAPTHAMLDATHAVFTRRHWADEWSVQPYLWCDSVRWASGSVRSEARLGWDYGEIMQPGDVEYVEYARKQLLGCYVLVEVAQSDNNTPLRWYGILSDDGRRRDGATPRKDGTLMPAGLQTLSAEGLDLLLMRTFVYSAVVNTAGGGKETHRRGITFNSPNSFDDAGNRSSSTGPDGVHIFARDLYDAKWWSTQTILEYILKYHTPTDAQGNQPITFQLSADAKKVLPDWDRPVVPTHGRSVRQIIADLCASKRNLSWQLAPVDGPAGAAAAGAPIELDVATYNAAPLTLPSGSVFQPNQNWVYLGDGALEIDRAVDAAVAQRDSDHNRVDQVVVRGARKRVVASFGYQDGTLEADWDAADETAYETLPTAIAALTDLSAKQARMQAYRREEQRQRVFSWFRVPADWDRKVSDALDGARSPIAIASDEAGTGIASIYLPEMRFERYLPKELFDTAPTDSPITPPPPLVFFKTEAALYEAGDQLAAKSGIEAMGDGAGRAWACSVRVQPDAPGVVVKVSGAKTGEGEGQHLIAKTDFAPISAINDRPGELDWQEMVLTAMVELDAAVEARYPADDDVDATIEAKRVRYIELGDSARLDMVHREAVVAVEDGEPQYRGGASPDSDHEYLRDDRPMMADLARFLYEQHARSRQAITLKFEQLASVAAVGQLILQIGTTGETAELTEALVTGVEMDLRRGTTRITTGYAELDPIQLV